MLIWYRWVHKIPQISSRGNLWLAAWGHHVKIKRVEQSTSWVAWKRLLFVIIEFFCSMFIQFYFITQKPWNHFPILGFNFSLFLLSIFLILITPFNNQHRRFNSSRKNSIWNEWIEFHLFKVISQRNSYPVRPFCRIDIIADQIIPQIFQNVTKIVVTTLKTYIFDHTYKSKIPQISMAPCVLRRYDGYQNYFWFYLEVVWFDLNCDDVRST